MNRTLLMALHWASRVIAMSACLYLSALGYSPLPNSFLLPIGICAGWISWELRSRKSFHPIVKILVSLSLLMSLIIFLYLLKMSRSDPLTFRHLIHLFIYLQLISLLEIISLREAILSLSISTGLILMPLCLPAYPMYGPLIPIILMACAVFAYEKYLKPDENKWSDRYSEDREERGGGEHGEQNRQ